MASCNFDAPNGRTSLLYTQLEAALGTDVATRTWMYTRSQEFGDRFLGGYTYDEIVAHVRGLTTADQNFEENLSAFVSINYGMETDSNGEPEFTWLARRLNLDVRTPEDRAIAAAGRPTVYTELSLFGTARRAERMSYEEALRKVQEVYTQAGSNPDLTLDLTSFSPIASTRTGNSGFTPLELANLFASLPIPENVHFSEEFLGLIGNTASRLLQELGAREVPLLNYDETQLQDVVDELYVPKRDAQGNRLGETFTSSQQVAGVDTMVFMVWNLVSRNPELLDENNPNRLRLEDVFARTRPNGAPGTLFATFSAWITRYQARINLDPRLTDEVIASRIENLRAVQNSWEDFARRALYRLGTYGLRVRDMRAVAEVLGQDNESMAEVLTEGLTGKGLESWYDSSFELDPKDTASARIKLFLASIPDAEVGLEKEPRKVNLGFKDPLVRDRILNGGLMGLKTMSIRTPAQMRALGLEVGKQYITVVDDVKVRVTVERLLTEADLNDMSIQGNANEEGVDAHVGDTLLRLERWRPDPQKVQVRENFLGFARLIDFEEVFQELLEITSGVAPSYEAMVEAIENEAKNYRPNLHMVVRELRKQPEQIKREFVKVMSKQYQEFSIMLTSRTKKGMLKMTPINANSGSAVTSTITQWRENQKHSAIVSRDANGNMVVNREVATGFGVEIAEFNRRIQAGDYPHIQNELQPFVARLLEANGIVMPAEALDYFFAHTERLTKGTTVAGSVHDQFKFNRTDGKPAGMFSAIVAKLTGETEEELDTEEYLLNNNPLYTEITSMRILARLAYKFSPRTAAGSHPNSEGKNIYAYGMNTHLSTIMKNIRTDERLRAQLEGTFAGRNNWILQKIKSGEIKDEFGLQYVDGLKQADRKNARGITRPNMSSREQLLFAMGQFQNGGYRNGNFLSLTHSDKTTTPLFVGVPKFRTRPELTKEVKDAVYNTFLGEYERIIAWHSQKGPDGVVRTKNDSFNKGGGLYYLIPQLNYDYLTSLPATTISPAEIELLWLRRGVPNPTLGVGAKALVQKIFEREFLAKETADLFAMMRAEGFLENKLIDEKYMTKNIANSGLIAIVGDDNKVAYAVPSTQRSVTNPALTDEQFMEHMMRFAAKDFVLNYFLFHSAISGLAFGDPALTFKPGRNSTLDYQQVEDSMKEYQKRLAKDIAPGQDPTWDNGPTEQYKTITIADDERVHEYLSSLPAYDEDAINGSDAQEVTTVREHLYVMKAMGLIADNVYNEMITIIDEGLNRDDKYYEFTDPRHVAVVMQIMKPVSVSHNFHEVDGMSTVQYIKSSSMPLYPPLTKKFQLDELRKVMEGDGKDTHIPRANFISAKKVGAPIGKGVRIFDGNGDINIDTTAPAWTDSLQVLSRGGFRIQQEVPYDEFKEHILTGSQMNKLFTQGIYDIRNFRVRGIDRDIPGTELKQMKEDTRKALVKLQLDAFSARVGIGPDGKADTTRLIAMLEEEATSRNYPPNDITMLKRRVIRMLADGGTIEELAIPLFFNPSSSRFESLLMSLIKGIGKVYMPGKSFIQASSAGFKFKRSTTWENLSDDERSGIVWVKGPDGNPLYDGGDLKIMTKDAEGNVTPAQVLLPFNFVGRDGTGREVTMNVEDFMTTDERGNRFLDTTRVPHELIEILGFRIPTQKHNSMLPIQVVGFVPSNLGDIIVVPAAITKQMGSDFDVDKLYAYRRPYNYNPETRGFSGITTDRAVEDMSEDELLTRYYDIAWGVLTHPDMYDTVLSPLDKPDLKNEAVRATTGGALVPFFSVKRQLDDFISQKDAKVMVGISSLAVTATPLYEDKNMRVERQVPSEDPNDVDDQGRPNLVPQPFGIEFIPEGEDQADHAYMISGRAEGTYYENDVENRMTPTGIRKVFVNPVTGEVVGDFNAAQGQVRTKLDDQTSLQSEFLDHAKNRTIDKLNINLQTINAALAMTHLSSTSGRKPVLKHLALFLRQPAIVRLVEEVSRSQDSLSTAFVPDLMNTKIDEMINEYVGLAAELDETIGITRDAAGYEDFLRTNGYTILSILDLKEGLTVQGDPAWFLQQAGMLATFRHLNNIGKELSVIQRVLNQDPRGPGKNMITALDTIAKRTNVANNYLIQGADALFQTEQGYIHHVELDTAATAYSDVLPYSGLVGIIDTIREGILGRTTMSVEDQQDVVEQFKSYIFSNPELGLAANAMEDRFRLLYGTTQERSLAFRVWEAQDTWGRDNYFLKRLQPQQADIPNTPSYVFYLASRASALDDQENTAAFLEMLVSTDERQRRLAEDLVRYAYVTGGISGSFSFIKYIPADYLIALPFAARLREVNRSLTSPESEIEYQGFIDQWVQHNPGAMPKITLEMLSTPTAPRTSLSERFDLPYITPEIQRGPLGKLIRTEATTGVAVYPPYISFFDKEEGRWKLFKLDGSVSYRRIDTLGNSYIYEYTQGQSGNVRSVISENRALIRQFFAPAIERTITDMPMQKRDIDGPVKTYGLVMDKVYPTYEIAHLLKKMRDDKHLKSHNRELADVLDLIVSTGKDYRPMTLELGSLGGANGGSAGLEGDIILFPLANGMSDHNRFSEVLQHEIIHQLIFPMTTMPKSLREQKYPEAAEAFERVRQIHEEAKAAVIAEAAKVGMDQQRLISAVNGQAILPTQRAIVDLYYTVNNIDEFITSVFTKPELQKFLNSQKSALAEDRSLLSTLLKFFTDFLVALGKSLGVDIKSGHMLEVALERSVELLEEIASSDASTVRVYDTYGLIADYTANVDMTVEAQVAEAVRKINEDFEHVKASYSQQGLIYVVKTDVGARIKERFNFSAEEKEVTNPVDRIYGKVLEQMSDIRASIAKDKMSPEILRQRSLLRELDLLAKDLKATGDLNRISELAAYQLKWAKTVADQYQVQGLPVSINELMTGHRLAALWTETISLMYGDDTAPGMENDPKLAQVQADATQLHNRYTSQIMKDVMKRLAAAQGRTLTDADFGKDLQDMPTAEAKFLSLERAKSRLVQEVAATIQNTHRHYLEDGDRLVKKVADLEKRAQDIAKKKGISTEALYGQLFQDGGHWGMVTRYSSGFYKWKAGLKNTLTNTIDKIMEEVPDERARAASIKDAYATYWRNLKRKAGYVDIRVLFDGGANEKQTVSAQKFRAQMVEEYGQELANELIKEAKTKFIKYMVDKKLTFDTLDTEVANGFMTAEEAETAKGQWDLENSPVHKLSTQQTVLSTKAINVAEKYLVLVPHKDAKDRNGESFFDSKFDTVRKDKAIKALYDEVREMMDNFTSNLPYYLDEKLGPDFLPAIQKKLISDVSSIPDYMKAMPVKFWDSLTASSYEEFMQSRDKKSIPIMYTKDPLASIEKPGKDATAEEWSAYNKLKEEKLKGYTKDLPRILEMFGLMSLHYKHFSEAKDAIDMGHAVLKKADKDMKAGLRQIERKGRKVTVKGGLDNTLGALEYAIDALVYKRTKDLEGKLGDLNRLKPGASTEKKVKELKAEVEAAKKKFRNNEITQSEYDTEMERINGELDSYEVRKFYASKIGDKLITWTQLKALSYNPLSAINNLAFGLISSVIHANGGQDFNRADFSQAFSIMMNSTGKSLRLTKLAGNDSAMDKASKKILALMERFGVMGELTDADYMDKSNVQHRKGGIKQTLSPYQMMRTGDYFAKGLNMVAVMLHQKVKVDGKEVSVWEAFDDTGRFKGNDKKWESEDVREQIELDKLRNKVIAVNKIIMGNQDKSSPMWAKKSILWRLVGQFRLSWFSEGIANRFESERPDSELGRTRKGRYRTYADLGPLQSVQMILKQMLTVLPGVKMDPYKGALLRDGREMSETDKANMRRNLAELGFFLLLYGAMHTIAMLGDPDDDDASKQKRMFIMNMLTRSYQDVALYSNPTVFDTILGTPAPALSAIRDTQAFVNASIKYATKDDYDFDKWILKLTRAGFIPQTTLINRYKTMTEKDLSTLAR